MNETKLLEFCFNDVPQLAWFTPEYHGHEVWYKIELLLGETFIIRMNEAAKWSDIHGRTSLITEIIGKTIEEITT